jgi:hypothetical protein
VIGLALALGVSLAAPLAARAAGSQEAKASLTARAVAYVQTLAKGHFKAAETDFTDAMKQAAPPDKLGEMWQSLISRFGPFEDTGETRSYVQSGYTFVIVKTDFKSRALGIRVVFDSARRIAGMQFVPPP